MGTANKVVRRYYPGSPNHPAAHRNNQYGLVVRAGDRFERLITVKIAEYRGDQVMWTCRCDCGKEIVVDSASLKKHKVKSCGSPLCVYKATKARMEASHEIPTPLR
jgi:hypothetical protein